MRELYNCLVMVCNCTDVYVVLTGEEGGEGLASSSPLGSAGGGRGGGGGTVGVVRVVDQGGSSSPHAPPTNLDVTIKKEEVSAVVIFQAMNISQAVW